jgi:hypothetical protein
MTKPDLALSQITARFTQHDVEWSRGAFMIIDRRTADPIARLRPIPETDRFELFYWSSVKGRWTTFGNLGRMKLMLKSAHEIVESDPMFRIPQRPMSLFRIGQSQAKAPQSAICHHRPSRCRTAGLSGFFRWSAATPKSAPST